MAIVEKFIDNLAKLLKEPPYLIFIFIGSIFVVVSLIFQRNLDHAWIFFLYSVAGTMWRYAERDFRTESSEKTVKLFKKDVRYKLIVYVVYHIGNIGLFLVLLRYLKLL